MRSAVLVLGVLATSAVAQEVAPTQVAATPPHVRTSLYVPVRDGTRLAVNIYRPAVDGVADPRPMPVIFAFTPYRARYRNAEGRLVETALTSRTSIVGLLRHGYVVAVADIRGKGASFGHRRGFQDRTEALDGRDLIQWLSKQTFATGKVGMMGCSYLGGTTFQTATTAPPALKAVFVGASELDKYGFVRRGGITAQFNTRADEPLSDDLMSLPVDTDSDGAMLKLAVAEHAKNTPMGPLWYAMPYRDSVSPHTGNAFWNEVAVYPRLDAIKRAGIATYFWSNWRDEPTSQVVLAAASTGGKFIAGPGDHCNPPNGFDLQGEIVRYFDHHLKGIDTGLYREPRATYHVQGGPGGGQWVKSTLLPGEGVKRTSWFLHGGKSGTSASVNDGVLGPANPDAGRDRFTVDYNLPPPEAFAFWIGPMDKHGLSYTSAPLSAPLKLVGAPVIDLTIAVDRSDANVFAYLDVVAPDGKVEVIGFGRLAASHRELSAAPFETLGLPWHSGLKRDVAPMKPGVAASLRFDLTPVSRIVAPGYRLRVTVTGADPRQRNLADIKVSPPPQIILVRGPSRIELPIAGD